MKSLFLVLFIIFLGLQYKLWIDEGNIRELRQLKQTLEQQNHRYQKIVLRNQALQAEIAELKAGGDPLEERARIDLGLVKEGETYYQIIE